MIMGRSDKNYISHSLSSAFTLMKIIFRSVKCFMIILVDYGQPRERSYPKGRKEKWGKLTMQICQHLSANPLKYAFDTPLQAVSEKWKCNASVSHMPLTKISRVL